MYTVRIFEVGVQFPISFGAVSSSVEFDAWLCVVSRQMHRLMSKFGVLNGNTCIKFKTFNQWL